ncbi:MAG TPA: DUF433 domain-containing protein [Pirellulales bacterium]
MVFRSDEPPLREDTSGALRVGDSRVLLELVIGDFQDGATPEEICQRYSTLRLSDVYSVIAYYLRHREDIDPYLADRERKTQEMAVQIEARQQDLSEIRARLQARRGA